MTVCAVRPGTVQSERPGEGTDATADGRTAAPCPDGPAPAPAEAPADESPADRPSPVLPPPPYRPLACVLSADGGYAARLASPGGTDRWCPERWTLDGPEPYAVPLPGSQPEDPHSQVLPLADGRVLILRRVDGRYRPSLLYPSGAGTGEVPLGTVDAAQLALLPPAPDGRGGFALAAGAGTTVLWRLVGGDGPERVAVVPGLCTDGVWLDRDGRMLALNRRGDDGVVKAVVVDLGRGGAVSPLLEIAEGSNDRVLLADPDSGLLLVRSDAPGADRVGWGVLGSHRPVRFPEALHPPGATVTPFAAQPGQALLPERCAVALRVDGVPRADRPCDPALPWLALWRPGWRAVSYVPAPHGWLRAGRFTAEGALLLPYATPEVRCAVARLRPSGPPAAPRRAAHAAPRAAGPGDGGAAPSGRRAPGADTTPGPGPARRPVPLAQAPLAAAGR
ncbi:hypothetical protein GCM10023347_39610 [Streptomyces chumphonensis]|uniref:hypothetical protein n=1 Tax=Streptomyces chumphonensis TaxID=1214925 RepID=UPI001CD1314A|nr:hypothetical protein [Streptomyces chumphonensis]